MARTVKWEHVTDAWRLNGRLERKARPAGRLVKVVEAELAGEEITDDAWIEHLLGFEAVAA